jgi:plasmid stabilization system protein ParE
MDLEARLWKEFERLGRSPGIGHRRRDLIASQVFFHRAPPYTILYRRDTDPIHILAVLHEARDTGSILNRRSQ